MTIAIEAESPLQDDVRTLVAELNATLLELTPPEFAFHMTVEQMAEPSTTVFIAREDGAAVACGALKRHAAGVGEVKRMYTRPSHRARKIGGRKFHNKQYGGGIVFQCYGAADIVPAIEKLKAEAAK